jgi:hypothetical protein
MTGHPPVRGDRRLARAAPERAWMYPVSGWIFIVLAALLSWSLWRSWS